MNREVIDLTLLQEIQEDFEKENQELKEENTILKVENEILKKKVSELADWVDSLNDGMTQFDREKKHNLSEALRLEGLLQTFKRKYDNLTKVNNELKKLK